MTKTRLYTPGPVETPPQVLNAASGAMLHHRSSAFVDIFLETRNRLAEMAKVEGEDVIILAASGSAAFEAGLINTVPKGAKVLSINAGKFGERWFKVATSYGYEVVEYKLDWGNVADPLEVARLLKEHPDCAALMTTHSETSTGALHDVAAISKAAKEIIPDMFVLVDCVTSLGVCDVDPNTWNIDGMFSGSQKGLMSPPGLAFAWLSERAWASVNNLNSYFYMDLRKERAAQQKGQTAYTAAVGLVQSLNVALEMLLAEGKEAVWARREHMNQAIIEAAVSMGCTPFAERTSPAVAALRAPEAVAAPDIVKAFAKRGMTIAGGQDHAKPYLFRPSVMGYADSYDVITVVAALEDVLRELGQDVAYGSAVAVAMKYLNTTA